MTHFQTLSGKEEYTVNPTLKMLAATKEIRFQEQEEAENGTSKTKEIFHEQEEAEMALPYRGKDAQQIITEPQDPCWVLVEDSE